MSHHIVTSISTITMARTTAHSYTLTLLHNNNNNNDNNNNNNFTFYFHSQIQSVATSRTYDDANRLMSIMEEETRRRSEIFEEEKKGEIAERVKDPPKLPRPIVEPPEYFSLVRGELLDLKCTDSSDSEHSEVVDRPHRVYVNRLRRRDRSSPLWMVSVYDVENGNSITSILEESMVVSIVEKEREEERKAQQQLPSPSSSASPQELQQRPIMVHQQGIRLPCGDTMIPALASVFVRRSGAHIRVTIKLHLRGKAAWLDCSEEVS